MNAYTRPRGLVTVRANMETGRILAELNDAFSTFKSRNEHRIEELHARLDELDMAGGRLGAGGFKAEQLDPHEVAAFYAAARRRDVAAGEVSTEELRPYAEAVNQYLRRGPDAIAPDVRAAMQVGSDPDGGYWVPPQVMPALKRRLFETSEMRRLASVMTITSDAVKLPLDTNDATSGGWVGETASRGETDTPQIGEQTIYLREQYAQPKVTQKLLDMSSFDVEGWLVDKITGKMGRTENTSFVTGTGVNQPRGFLDYAAAAVTDDDSSRSWGVLQYVPTGQAGGFPTLSGIPGAADPDSLIDLQMKLKPAYRANATWVMNRATAGTVRKMKDGDGRLLWQDSMQQGTPPLLLGSPVAFFEDMPDINSDTFSIAYGDFRQGYQIVDGPGVRVLRDPYTTKGWVKFYATKWTGGDVIDFDAIKLLKFGTS